MLLFASPFQLMRIAQRDAKERKGKNQIRVPFNLVFTPPLVPL